MTTSRIVPPGGASGRVLAKASSADYDVEWAVGGSGSGIDELSGDVTAGPGSGLQVATVVALQGRTVQNVGPSDGDVLTWNNGASRWEPAAPGGGGLGNYDVRKRAAVLCRGGR